MEQTKDDRLVLSYVKIRDKLSGIRKIFKGSESELKGHMGTISGEINRRQNEQGLTQWKVMDPEGKSFTAFKTTKDKVRVDDWGTFLKWMIENEAYHVLTQSVSKDAVKEFMREHKGMLPPGIKFETWQEVQVRKS